MTNGKNEKLPNVLELGNHKAKRTEICDPWILHFIFHTFDLIVFKMIWGHSVQFS